MSASFWLVAFIATLLYSVAAHTGVDPKLCLVWWLIGVGLIGTVDIWRRR